MSTRIDRDGSVADASTCTTVSPSINHSNIKCCYRTDIPEYTAIAVLFFSFSFFHGRPRVCREVKSEPLRRGLVSDAAGRAHKHNRASMLTFGLLAQKLALAPLLVLVVLDEHGYVSMVW